MSINREVKTALDIMIKFHNDLEFTLMLRVGCLCDDRQESTLFNTGSQIKYNKRTWVLFLRYVPTCLVVQPGGKCDSIKRERNSVSKIIHPLFTSPSRKTSEIYTNEMKKKAEWWHTYTHFMNPSKRYTEKWRNDQQTVHTIHTYPINT